MYRNPEGLPNTDRTSQEYFESCVAQVPPASDGSRYIFSVTADRAPISFNDLRTFVVIPDSGKAKFDAYIRLISLGGDERDNIVRSLPHFRNRLYFIIAAV